MESPNKHNSTSTINNALEMVSDTHEPDEETEFVITNKDGAEKLRGRWSNRVEFFLAIMGYTVGMGNIWKFPIVCGRNGGGAFLIPFFFFLITSGGPLYYAEVCLGQFCGKSAGLAFGCCPLLKGLGFLQVSLSLFVMWYGIFISVWIYYYLYSAFSIELPWTTCDNTWNTDSCKVDSMTVSTIRMNSVDFLNTSLTTHPLQNGTTFNSPSFEFWKYKVISKSRGLEDMGSLQLHLVVCLVICWSLVVLAVIKGTKTLGKVVYVSATLPFLFLAILLVRGLLLEGSVDGIVYYLKPDFALLLEPKTWQEAALQVFYSLGPTWGGVITMASYNKFHQKTFWSSTLCVACSGFCAFFNGLVVFSIIGYMARESGKTVEQLATQSGPGLVFLAFPTALSKMPLPQFWSVLFFLMLATVTFDSIFGTFETIASALIDLFPSRLLSKRVHVNVCLGVFLTLTGLPLCMNGGIYVLQLFDWYAPMFSLLLGSCLECVALFWLYGTDRFCNDIVIMTGRQTSSLLRFTWTVVIPIFTGISFVSTVINIGTPDYGDGYEYATGPIVLGVFIGLIPILGMLGYGIFVVLRARGTLLQRLKASIRPDDSWLPNDTLAAKEYLSKTYIYPDSITRRLLVDLRGDNDA